MTRWSERLRRFANLNHTLADLQARINEATHRTNVVAARLDVLMREHRAVARQLTLPASDLWQHGPPASVGRVTAADALTFSHSVVCRQESFETPVFQHWMQRLSLPPRYHRKQWEFAFICQVLEERGMLRNGARGLGFGVGREPLAACFASRGCRIVATDMAVDQAVAAGWQKTREHASGKESLRHRTVCPDGDFDANVTFQLCDMNAVDPSLHGFDFCWSACALEHLGTIDQGLAFIERSVECLVPGGVAVHTTEFNVGSNDETLAEGPAVLFRRRDFEAFADRILGRGWSLAPFDFDTGSGALDRYVDLPPYLDQPHLKLTVEGYATTSIGLIIRRAPEA